MKHKGFTLVELLAIITILGVIATIITPIIQKSLKANKEKVYEIVVEQIENHAKDYSMQNTSVLPDNEGEKKVIKLSDLKKAGLLEIEVINPMTNNFISNESIINITKKNNNYIFEANI